MAVVLYQGDTPSTSGSTNTKSGGKNAMPQDLRVVDANLKRLLAGERAAHYLGLSNQGATCYMNSLLQSLFMTAEFREFIYSYQYNPDLHGSKEYCIPYQLQKLFARQQLSMERFCLTKDLTKSFHWGSAQSFEQQDVQEFCRVLFDAIDTSFKIGAVDPDSVSRIPYLYEGASQSFVKCLECNYESLREDKFQDLSLPIKNEFGTGVLNSSLEMALENYIKPEMLDGGNQYFCEKCQSKQDAEKGIKLTKCPKVLTVALNRFTLDFETFQRVKIYERVSFPRVINMNDYLKGYEGITNKKYDQEVERMKIFQAERVKKNQDAEEQRQQQREKKQKLIDETQQSAENPDQPIITESNESVTVAQSTPATTSTFKTSEKGVKITVGDQIPSQDQTSQPVDDKSTGKKIEGTFDEETYNKFMLDTSGPKQKKMIIEYGDDQNDDYANFDEGQANFNTVDGSYAIKGNGDKFVLGVTRDAKLRQQEDDEELQRALDQIREMEEKEKESKSTQQLTKEYLQEGPHVYELFSVMVHSGGAYGGHYFAYIKSFEDGKWYNFNDGSVTETTEEIVFQAFGGNQSRSSATAYMLMYRQVDSENQNLYKFSKELIPQELQEEVQKETDAMIKEQQEAREKILALKLKLFHDKQSIHVDAKKDQTIKEILQTGFQLFGIDKPIEQARLRLYDALMHVRLGVYEDLNSTLIDYSIPQRATLDIEFKDPQTNQFEEYNENWIHLKTLKYVEGVDFNFNDGSILPTLNVKIDNKQDKVSDLELKIAEMYDIPVDKLIIMLRHEKVFNDSVRAEYFNMAWRKDKKLSECSQFDHGAILFIEEGEPNKYDSYNWKKLFSKEQEKMTLSFNEPTSEVSKAVFDQKVTVYKSDTLLQLKQAISNILYIKPENFYVKRNATQRELKDKNKSLLQLGLTTGQCVTVIQGKPHLEGQFDINLQLIKLYENDPDGDDSLVFTKELLAKVQVKPEMTVKLFKQQIIDVYNKKFGDMPLQSSEEFTLRHPKVDDLGDIVSNDEEILDDLYLIDDKEFYVQVHNQEQNTYLTMKPELESQERFSLLIREFDPDTWQLGKLHELRIPKLSKVNDLTSFVQSQIFKHIPIEYLFLSKVGYLKQFKRSDLALKKWVSTSRQTTWIGQSSLEINRDAILIVVKDNRKHLRENLTEDELRKYASSDYINHLRKKKDNKSMSTQSKDPLMAAASSHIGMDLNKPLNRRPETGVSITVAPGALDTDQLEGQFVTNDGREDKEMKNANEDDEPLIVTGNVDSIMFDEFEY